MTIDVDAFGNCLRCGMRNESTAGCDCRQNQILQQEGFDDWQQCRHCSSVIPEHHGRFTTFGWVCDRCRQ
jgi:hypothetical protein